MKANKNTYKALRADFEEYKKLQQLKNKTAVTSQTVTTDSKGTQKLTNRFREANSWALFIITTLLSYGHKIPVLSKIIKLAAIWYGRTTWWKLLVKARKVFIVLNALIGIYTMFKITGFSTDNIIGGLYGRVLLT